MIKKRISSTKTRNSDTNTDCSFFCSVVEKTEQYCKKNEQGYKNTDQWYKTHSSAFGLLWEKPNSSEKQIRKMVQKHQTVVQNTLFRFCSVVSCEKNGTVVQKTEQWYKNTLFLFVPLFLVKKTRTYHLYFGFICWERADLLALLCGVCCEFVTFTLVSWVRCGT